MKSNTKDAAKFLYGALYVLLLDHVIRNDFNFAESGIALLKDVIEMVSWIFLTLSSGHLVSWFFELIEQNWRD